MGTWECVVGGPDPLQVARDTWGHLNSRPNVCHPGVIVFAHGTYGDLVVLSADFGETAGDGPWFHHHLHEWLCDQDTQPGCVYRFTGWYRHNGNDHDNPDDESYEFVGDTVVVALPD